MRISKKFISGIQLDSAGLVALADLSTIQQRTALMGTASIFDILFLAPGIHTQQDADCVNCGELPTTGALHSGYVFRVENPATVNYLRKIGRTGHLVTVHVQDETRRTRLARHLARLLVGGPVASLLYALGIALTVACVAILGAVGDLWAMGVLLMLVGARLLNTIVVTRRARMGWKGAPEPGVRGDLLVLLSQDRWIRMQGLVDDIKAVTAGHWLREQTAREGFVSAFAMLLVYGSAALAPNSTTFGNLLIALLLLISVAMLEVCNSLTDDMHVFDRRISVAYPPKKYTRRLDMVKELVVESGRHDWAVKMDLVSEEAILKMTKDGIETPQEKDTGQAFSMRVSEVPSNIC
ncbi:hypothetical protein EIP86_004892 [Pleurotus ostreatoroseus]|nr:hypothetical protein EIP86_004892 [Pleurotus ostreatoroseus]